MMACGYEKFDITLTRSILFVARFSAVVPPINSLLVHCIPN